MSSNSHRLNRGEWSEVYTFLRLLADGRLYAADENMNKNSEIYYDLISIIRNNLSTYNYHQSDIEIITPDSSFQISVKQFEKQANLLLDAIRSSSGRSFPCKDTSVFMTELQAGSLTAGSQSKRDITIVIDDYQIGHQTKLGFSIKSQLGGLPTLFNASGVTNFQFVVENIQLTGP